jgi:glyoxylase-like metal-dependent hydrolase (beta-lactamase superfamily II)
VILEQHHLTCLSQASYLVGDAAVVDPRRDVGIYLEAAERLGVEIKHVLLTHFHADFLAGHLELAAATGATLHLGAAAAAEFTRGWG